MTRPVMMFEINAGLDVQEQIQAKMVIHPNACQALTIDAKVRWV